MCLKVRATLTEVFPWHRWFFLSLESAVWQPGVAMFLKYSLQIELHNLEWETSLKLNWTKAVYQRSFPPMATQVQESILVSKTSIQFCTVEFLPIIMSSILVLSFSGLVKRFLHKHIESVLGLTIHEIQFSLCILFVNFFMFYRDIEILKVV